MNTTKDLGCGDMARPKLIGQGMVDKALAAGQCVRRKVNDDGTVSATVLREVSRYSVLRSEAAALGLEEKGN